MSSSDIKQLVHSALNDIHRIKIDLITQIAIKFNLDPDEFIHEFIPKHELLSYTNTETITRDTEERMDTTLSQETSQHEEKAEVETEVKTEVETEVKTEVETEVKTEVETEVENVGVFNDKKENLNSICHGVALLIQIAFGYCSCWRTYYSVL